MLTRAAITGVVWLICLAALTTSGQQFTHAIVLLVAAVLGALPWLPLLRRQYGARQRVAALAVVAVSALVVVRVSLDLPRAHEAQQRMNSKD